VRAEKPFLQRVHTLSQADVVFPDKGCRRALDWKLRLGSKPDKVATVGIGVSLAATLEEERSLVEAVRESDPIMGAYVALLGETRLRKAEGLRLQWQHVNVNQRIVSIEETKSNSSTSENVASARLPR
jgi:integrase